MHVLVGVLGAIAVGMAVGMSHVLVVMAVMGVTVGGGAMVMFVGVDFGVGVL